MNQVTRVLALRRDGDRWRSTSAEVAGFVPMQGTGARRERPFPLHAPGGGEITLRFDQDQPDALSLADRALDSERLTAWSGVTIGGMTSFEDLQLWLASFLPGFCKVMAGDAAAQSFLGGGTPKGWYPYGATNRGSLAYLVARKIDHDTDTYEFGAAAFGPHAQAAADALNSQVRAWDAIGRDLPPDASTFWPAGISIPPLPEPASVFPKHHGTVTVRWDGARPWRAPNANARATR